MWISFLSRVPRFELDRRWHALGLFYLFFALFYSAGIALQIREPIPYPFNPMTSVGFFPGTVWIYWLQPAFIAFCFSLFRRAVSLNRTIKEMLLILALSTAVFILFPTHLPRDKVVVPSGALARAFSLLHALDPPTNCFPSLHVSIAVLVSWRAGEDHSERPALRLALLFYASVIAITTLTTHQHHLFDVLGGAGLAVFVMRFSSARSTKSKLGLASRQ